MADMESAHHSEQIKTNLKRKKFGGAFDMHPQTRTK